MAATRRPTTRRSKKPEPPRSFVTRGQIQAALEKGEAAPVVADSRTYHRPNFETIDESRGIDNPVNAPESAVDPVPESSAPPTHHNPYVAKARPLSAMGAFVIQWLRDALVSGDVLPKEEFELHPGYFVKPGIGEVLLGEVDRQTLRYRTEVVTYDIAALWCYVTGTPREEVLNRYGKNNIYWTQLEIEFDTSEPPPSWVNSYASKPPPPRKRKDSEYGPPKPKISRFGLRVGYRYIVDLGGGRESGTIVEVGTDGRDGQVLLYLVDEISQKFGERMWVAESKCTLAPPDFKPEARKLAR